MHRCFDVNAVRVCFDVRATFLALEMSEMRWVGKGQAVEMSAGQVLLAHSLFCVSLANFGSLTVDVSRRVGRTVNRDCFCLTGSEVGSHPTKGSAVSSDGRIGLDRRMARTMLSASVVEGVMVVDWPDLL